MPYGARYLLAVALAVLLAAALIRICADGGAMAAAYRACECRGVEWQLYDGTAADGPRRTICVGFVSSRTCYRSRGGPRVPCEAESREDI